ncbi:hypothetical protein ALP12_02164 [Pseudomonas savastanoi pv. phaseolicola]|uniref:hypothetical protein n=1 Tax=Pseudomonas savastanoi TaxID=29438 RepID=UPI000EFE840F|nr:hypothetical protein [Pseudomonas savastanoi]RMV31967.1 hypothetical protein ALP12_02164 [Pseudomonas savastanoi pv. phaseolicola]
MTNHAECKAAGISPAKVEKHRAALVKLMKAMASDNIMLFGGGDGSTLRPWRMPDEYNTRLILADVSVGNIDGGAGACHDYGDGLVRGES